MNFFDKVLNNINNIINIFVNFLQKITRIEIFKKIEKFFQDINATLLIITSINILICGIIYYQRFEIDFILPIAIFSPFALLIVAYFAKNFDDVCSNLIRANKTSCSTTEWFKLSAVIFCFVSATLFIVAIGMIFNGNFKSSLLCICLSLFFFLVASVHFNPSLLNIEITKQASAGEDVIANLSSFLKTPIVLTKSISTLLIIFGNFSLLLTVTDSYVSIFGFNIGLILIFLGVAATILNYLTFLPLWFVNSLFLAVLSLTKKK